MQDIRGLLIRVLLIWTIICGSSEAFHPLPYSPTNAYMDFSTKAIVAGPFVRLDSSGIPEVYIDGQWVYNTVTIAQYGLQQFSYGWETNSPSHYANALNMGQWLLDHQDPTTGCWYYSFDYTTSAVDVTLLAPWPSAQAQGHALSLLMRLYAKYRDPAYLAAAEKALWSFDLSPADGGVTSAFFDLATLPYYEEYPTQPYPSFVLNGFMFSLLGLYDTSVVAAAEAPAVAAHASQLYEAGMGTLSHVLPHYDLGIWTAYHLGHLTRPQRRVDSAQSYHVVHVVLLAYMTSFSDAPALAYYRDLWFGYLRQESSTFVSVSVPSQMTAGQEYAASVTLRNSGDTTWGSSVANPYVLGSAHPSDNLTWGRNRAYMPPGTAVPPGASYTFTFTVTAPSASGTYTFRWQMLREGGVRFGDVTPEVSVQVMSPDFGPYFRQRREVGVRRGARERVR